MSQLEQFVNQCYKNILENKNLEIESAISYLDKRGIKPKTVDLHKIGYCSSSDIIPRDVLFYGKDPSTITKETKSFEYRIRKNIIVPIYSEFGDLVGIATRKPTFEKGNSWWNIARPFKKGNHLFLLDKVKNNILKNNKIYLVEGYMDALILAQEGLPEVVAVMGTDLSTIKVGLIARYCNNVCICLDADANKAGQTAQEEFIYDLKKIDFCESISVIDGLPIGEDPDVFVMKNGIQSFLNLEKKLTNTQIVEIYKRISSKKS